jgi:cytochrome c peroxidase
MRRSTLVVVSCAPLLAALVGCEREPKQDLPEPKQVVAKPRETHATPRVIIDRAKLVAFGKLPDRFDPKEGDLPEARVALGKSLYFETRLSKGHDLSCNSCHRLDEFGVDGKPTSPGHKGQLGDRNSPSVYNAAGHFLQFWDGRAADVEEQATGPIVNPVEMASDEKRVVATLSSIPEYAAAFAKAFPGDPKPITLANIGRAIAAFERTLTTPARWDRYVAGDEGAITDAEKAGFEKFVETGCPTCHAGPLVGGGMFQKLGLIKPWPTDADPGRAKVTKNDGDKLFFKVPSLRNVAKTAPYFHDGSVPTLEAAVAKMAAHQLGKELSDADVKAIVTWLGTLTGTLPKIEAPVLPKSGPTTPKPDLT